jgi:hypothetical protein
VAQAITPRGYFSILRWASDATRDEARNVAVVLVDAEGQFGGVRAAPPSSLSSSLREQGLLDSLIQGLSHQFDGPDKPDLQRLGELRGSLEHSLYLTEPRPAAVADVAVTLRALYRAYVTPRSTPRALTKSVVLDGVMAGLRRRGLTVSRSEYVDDFIFDVVVRDVPRPAAVEVLSFATATKDWVPAERDAGHFIYGLQRVGLQGHAVIQPPSADSAPTAHTSYERVTRWFNKESVPVISPAALAGGGRLAIGA